MLERQAACREARRRKEIDDELRQPCQSGKVHLFVASADIGMDERSTNACEASRRVPDLSQHEIAFRRRRAAMRRQCAVEGDDAPPGRRWRRWS